MESIITVTPTFDGARNANILVKKTIAFEGETITKNWRCVLAKGSDLTAPLDTTFGPVSLDDFPAERDYILAKWAE